MDFHFPDKRENEEKTEMEDDEVSHDLDVEFWPVEHPVEPEAEDRPVKCPVPISSSLLHDEDSTEGRREMGAIRRATEAPRAVRVVRKRHHSYSGSNNVVMSPMIPISIVSPLGTPTASQQSNVFRVLQQVDHFES